MTSGERSMTEPDSAAGAAGAGRPTVVVGVDGSEMCREVLLHALVAAARRGADLLVVSSVAVELYYLGGAPLAVPDLGDIRGETHDRVRALVEEARADATSSAVAGAADVGITLVVSTRPPAPELVERSRDAELLVVGSRGRGAALSVLLGSVALHCATHADCPVVVVRPAAEPTDRPARVVVGVDGSVGSRQAVLAAVEEAARIGGSVEAVSSYQPTDHWTDLASVVVPSVEEIRARLGDAAREQVDAALREASERGIAHAPEVRIEVVEGPPGDVLTRRARGADLLVVGSRGRGAFRAVLLGSVALHCVMHASCPVMVVRPAEGGGADDRSRPASAVTSA